ncbi:MAG: AraC family ligand binding domain-containing protein, partial [Burkholderiales bacterium]|nr:AraC family ligand binding domain-containing protein [Burkholderiales bacterium]
MSRPRPAPLPAYALYGEPLAGGAPDPLHCESIAERSRLHGWEIRPHRHEALFQLLVVERGRAEAWLDGAVQRLQGPAAITVPALAAHGFRFSPSIEGMVFTLAEPRLAALLQPHPGLAAAVLRLQGAALGPEAAAVLGAARGLRDEALGHAGW